MGPTLAAELAAEAGLDYADEGLDEVYAAAKHDLGSRLNSFLEQRLRHCKASKSLCELARYPWARIYTLNIDDALEDALRQFSSQRVAVRLVTCRSETCTGSNCGTGSLPRISGCRQTEWFGRPPFGWADFFASGICESDLQVTFLV